MSEPAADAPPAKEPALATSEPIADAPPAKEPALATSEPAAAPPAKKTLKERLPVVMASGLEMTSGSVFLLLQSIVYREDWGRVSRAPLSAWGGILFLAVFGSIIGFTAFAFTRHTLPSPALSR